MSGSEYLAHCAQIESRRREPTSGLEPLTCSLRVRKRVLPGCAQSCKPRISEPVSFLCFAPSCTVLRSRWYQNGMKISFLFGSFRSEPAPLQHGELLQALDLAPEPPALRSVSHRALD